MKNPSAIHLSDDAYFRNLGWAAVSRDKDGHAMTSHAPFADKAEKDSYVAEEKARGHTVTFLR